MLTDKKNTLPEIPRDVQEFAVAEAQTRTTVLRMLHLLSNCGLSAGAPPILKVLQPRG